MEKDYNPSFQETPAGRSKIQEGTLLRLIFKAAFRRIRKHKTHAAINIFGLSVGMCAAFFIFLWVADELSYDNFQRHAGRIFRITQISRTSVGTKLDPIVPAPLGPAILRTVPGVEAMGRVFTSENVAVKIGRKTFYEDVVMNVDEELLRILTIPFLRGDPAKALSRPQAVVLSASRAVKYFGSEEALGKTISIDGGDYKVTGIASDPPHNTHFKYGVLMSMKSMWNHRFMSLWTLQAFYTYLKLAPGTDAHLVNEKIAHIADRYAREELSRYGLSFSHFLQPVSDLHLHGCRYFELEPPMNPLYVQIFFVVGLVILIIACVNFVNLTMANLSDRARETGIKKMVGAQKAQLLWQYLGENFVLILLSMLLALAITGLSLKYLNDLFGNHLSLNVRHSPLLAIFFILFLFSGILVTYPAFVFSSCHPGRVLKDDLRFFQKAVLRKVLVILQIFISLVLTIGALCIFRQYDFLRNRSLGFDKKNKMIISIRGENSLSDHFAAIKEEFERCPGIAGATVSSELPGQEFNAYLVHPLGVHETNRATMYYLSLDEDFLSEYRIGILAGTAFDRRKLSRFDDKFILNAAAVRALGFRGPAKAVGTKIFSGRGKRNGEIIGVAADFNFHDLKNSVEPLVLHYSPEEFHFISLSLRAGDPRQTMEFVKSKWKQLYPNDPLEYYFLEDALDHLLNGEKKLSEIIAIFAVLCIVIAGLGLFAIAAYSGKQRAKEIGIRKVNGAPVAGIVLLLLQEVLKWMLIANLFAWPVAYLLMRKWLQNFSYPVAPSLASFVLASAGMLLVALTAVGWQSLRAAMANPLLVIRSDVC